jgi:serine/threonine protein kinase
MIEADKSKQIRLLGKWWNLKRVIAAKKSLKPDILIAELDGEFIVAKDFRNTIWVARRLWGPLNIMYEKFILQKLRDVKGIPAFIGLEDYNCLLISYINGDEIKKSKGSLAPTYFADLFNIARDIHSRGVIHLDLGHKSNVMVNQNGNPAIIDFNTSIYLPRNALFSPLFQLLMKIDNLSILRLKLRFSPQETTLNERQQLKKFMILRKLWIFDKLSRRITNISKKERKPLLK